MQKQEVRSQDMIREQETNFSRKLVVPSYLKEEVTFAQNKDLPWIKSIADAHRQELGFINRSMLAMAVEKQEILCVSDGFLHFHHRQDQVSTLYHLCVKSDQRRKGIGRQLIKAWEDHSQKNGITTLRLKCPIDLQANGFYARIGFKRVGIDPGKNRSLVVWEKKLLLEPLKKTQFITSLSTGAKEIENLRKLWSKNQEFCSYKPFQNVLYSPLSCPASTTDYFREEKEANRISSVWIDCGAYQVQQGKFKYEELLAFLKNFYQNNQWADGYVLPDLVPLSIDSDENVEYKVQETIYNCSYFFKQMPSYIQKRAIAPIQGRTVNQIYRCLESYAKIGITRIGFGSWGTSGPNGSVNTISTRSLDLFEKIYLFAREYRMKLHCFGIGGPQSYNRLRNYQVIPHSLDSTTWWKAGGFGSIFFPNTSQIQVTVKRGVKTTKKGLEKLKQETNHSCYYCQNVELLRTSRNHRIMHNLAAWLETLES